MTDVIRRMGVAALGTRLRRLSERLDRDVREIYVSRGIAFEASWFPVIAALNERGPLSVGELAKITGVSQPAISQIRKRVEAEGYVRAHVAEADQRRQELALTEKGRRLIAALTPIWEAVAEASAQLCRDAAPSLLAELEAIERLLDDTPLRSRALAKLAGKTQPKPASKTGRTS